jgi:hypothetical protein
MTVAEEKSANDVGRCRVVNATVVRCERQGGCSIHALYCRRASPDEFRAESRHRKGRGYMADGTPPPPRSY